MTTPHLWEIDHPYYCTHGNFFVSPASGEAYSRFDSWAEFYKEWGESDPEVVLVFRWDWQRSDPDDYPGEGAPPDMLSVFWVHQGDAYLRSAECVVTEADEPAVRTWLAERSRAIAAVWNPFLTPGANQHKN